MATTHHPPTTEAEWRAAYALTHERDVPFTTLSGTPVKALYTKDDLGDGGEDDHDGRPGVYPFTRGVYPSMYRGRLWTMRQFAGFGTAEETNERFRYLLANGQDGLSTAFDMPTPDGLRLRPPARAGEVGREGVAIDTVDDMGTLFDGIDLGEISVSMTINAPGRRDARVLRRRRRGARASQPSACAGRSRPTSSRSTSPRRSGASRSTRRCACAAT